MDGPPPSVEFAEAEELERLRRPAYGRDADIEGDAPAQARLSELERAEREHLTRVVDAYARGPAPVPEHVPVPELVERPLRASALDPHHVDGAFTDQDPAEGLIADSDGLDEALVAPWWRRRRWLAILGGAVVALVLIVAQVASMSHVLGDGSTPVTTGRWAEEIPPVPDGFAEGLYLPAPDYVLAVKSVGAGADRPNDMHGALDSLGISRDELTRYEDFEGPVVRDL